MAAKRRRRLHLRPAFDAGRSSAAWSICATAPSPTSPGTTCCPHWNLDTVNFWSQIAFAFTGLELVSAMSEEVRDPRKTLPRAVMAAGVLIAVIYIIGTFAVLAMIPAAQVEPTSGVFQAITDGSTLLRIGLVGVLAALLVTVGNAGGVGSTVAGIARVPFVVGIDRYFPPRSAKFIRAGRLPTFPSSCRPPSPPQFFYSAKSTKPARRIPIPGRRRDHPLLHSLPVHVRRRNQARRPQRPPRKLPSRADPRRQTRRLDRQRPGLSVVLAGIVLSLIPPGDSSNKLGFELKLVGGTVAAIAIGLILYYRGARTKSQEA